MPLARHLTLFVAAFVFAAVSASAQLAPVSNPSGIATASADESSSVAEPLVADGAAPGASGAAAQEDHGHGYHEHGGMFSHMAFEAGAGFNGPIGNDTPYITWGGNFTGGAGFHFSKRFSVLGEFQFIDDKLPGAFVAIGGGTTGDAHIISITGSPVFDLFPKSSNSVYLTGGYGYYHKSTNFNVEVCCDYYGYPETLTANSFTSNQQGANIGVGFTHRLGGVYGDSTTKLFAEARYLYVHTPPITQNNGLGTTELIPVTLGVRW
jgi:hypothetical protein